MNVYQIQCKYPGRKFALRMSAETETDAMEAVIDKYRLDPAQVKEWQVAPVIRSPQLNTLLRAARRDCSRGAPMGKSNFFIHPDRACYLQRVRFVDGGYAPDGTYWGYSRGENLYCAFTPDLANEVYVRAKNRREAVKALKEMFPEMKFALNGKGETAQSTHAAKLNVTEDQMRDIAALMRSNKHPTTILDKIAAIMGRPVKVKRSTDRKELARWVDVQATTACAPFTVLEWREKFYVVQADKFINSRSRIFGEKK